MRPKSQVDPPIRNDRANAPSPYAEADIFSTPELVLKLQTSISFYTNKCLRVETSNIIKKSPLHRQHVNQARLVAVRGRLRNHHLGIKHLELSHLLLRL